MKRYAVCKIIGDGQSPETAFRPAVQDLVDPTTGTRAYSIASVIATGADGKPTLQWCLCVIASKRMDIAQANADVDLLPDVPLDRKVTAIQAATRSQMTARLAARGIDTAFTTGADGFRDIVRGLGRLHQADFDENKLDVSE